MILQSLALERRLSESKLPGPLALLNDAAETLFDKGFEGGLLLGGKPSGLFEEAIGYLDGCLHIADSTLWYARLSTERARKDQCRGTSRLVLLQNREACIDHGLVESNPPVLANLPDCVPHT